MASEGDTQAGQVIEDEGLPCSTCPWPEDCESVGSCAELDMGEDW